MKSRGRYNFVAESFYFNSLLIIFLKKNQRNAVTLSEDGGARRNRLSRMGITLERSNTDDFTWKD